MIRSRFLLTIFLSVTSICSAQVPISHRTAKKEQRISNRYIPPKSKFISASGGFAFTATATFDPNAFIRSGQLLMNNHTFPRLGYEHGLTKNFFLEGEYEFGKISITLGREYAEDLSWATTERFALNHNNHIFKIGGGYRVIGKKNFHYFSLHGGLFFGVSNKSKADMEFLINTTATLTINEFTPPLEYQIQRTIQDYSRFSWGPYVSISHELRITSHIRLVFKYDQRLGFNNIFSGKYEFSDNLNLENDASFKVNGSGIFISGGVKFLLFENNWKPAEK